MKRRLALLGLVLWLTGCASDTETDYASALMWNDTIYYLSVQEVGGVPESAVIGTVTAETETFPRENGLVPVPAQSGRQRRSGPVISHKKIFKLLQKLLL